ncbi:hypothetical protein [Tomitella fengzijianii]|nr:hypothetical protein [Tomitella fengzijianii]
MKFVETIRIDNRDGHPGADAHERKAIVPAPDRPTVLAFRERLLA